MNRYIHSCLKLKGIIPLVLMLFTLSAASQNSSENKLNIEVKGLIRDAHTKKPINAAQISLQDKKSSAVTDEDGKFSIKVQSLKDVLQVVAYDYNTTEIALRGRDLIVIDLYSNQFSSYFKNVDVITGTKRNSSINYGLKSVDDLSKTNVVAADEMMYVLGGNVRSVSRSGIAGIGSSLFIRGINSLNANAQPLFVVDGVIWNSLYDVESVHSGFFSDVLDNIDVNDIENITVLKDATSIYGSKASNGVILINTKRGKSMVTKIGLNMFTGIKTQPSSFPMMNGEQFRTYASELLSSKGVSPRDISKFDFLETDPSNKMIYNMYHNNTNWDDEVYQQGSTQNYNISVTGGDEKAMYYFSLGYTGNKDVVKTVDFSRINSRFNADFNFMKNFTMKLNIGFTHVERTNIDDGISPLSVTWLSKIKSPFLSPYSFTTTGELATDYASTDSFNIGNPTAILKYKDVNGMKKNRFNLGFLPSYQITKDLSLSTMFDYSLDKTTERRFIPQDFTPVIYIPEYNGYSHNEVNSQVMRNTAVFDDTRLTYVKNFNGLHNLRTILGWRYLTNYYEADYAEGHNTNYNSNTTINKDLSFLQVNGINNRTNSLSNYLNAEYNFDNRYFATATVSIDGSSRFGKETEGGFSLFGHSWAVFPSLYAGWIASSERFMKNLKFIDFLKLRMGYGLTGNDGIKDYESMAYFTSVRFMDRANGLVLANIENSKIQWETTGKASVGMDMNLLNNRLSLSFDLFKSYTSNLLVMRTLPEVSGLLNYWDNGGKLTNSGYEASLNWRALNLSNLKWEIGFSVGHYKNKITSLPYGSYTTSVYGGEVLTSVGQSASVFYGYKTNGVFATNAEAEAADLKILNTDGTYTSFKAGDIIFEEVEKDGIIDEKDKQVIGDPNPDIYGTIFTKIAVKRFTLNTVFTYSYGNDVYNYQRRMLESGSDFSNQTTAMLRRWTAEGQVTDQPKAYYGDPMGNARFSDRWIEDGSYLRLKNITLSYDVPIKSDFIEGFTIWASANNLVTFTKYLGLDPEFSAKNSVYYQGIDAGLVPLTKSYYLGVKFNL
ncbi:SusC/RagA family TonB-linked outer membrane protein [uncultured Paludibacter sp.]|uniref:SusC/RagA family TonB-linked outer membrane protein n=1 Tax=uncultured Paludibacter sp. TaxID=497635 RepID=A0A653AAQ2_9BACT|nr:SusC/RagA family TonB-linked outer membrane protein [uncultured Paludibacter sp.]